MNEIFAQKFVSSHNLMVSLKLGFFVYFVRRRPNPLTLENVNNILNHLMKISTNVNINSKIILVFTLPLLVRTGLPHLQYPAVHWSPSPNHILLLEQNITFFKVNLLAPAQAS